MARERHGAGSGRSGPRARSGSESLRRALCLLCLLCVGAGAKLVLVILRVYDGAAAGLASGWAPATLLYQEIRAALEALAHAHNRVDRRGGAGERGG